MTTAEAQHPITHKQATPLSLSQPSPSARAAPASGRDRYAALVLLRALRCSLLLRSRHKFLDAVHFACDLVFPGLTAELAAEAMRNKLPSATTLWRAQFHADLCMMEFERRLRRHCGPYYLYMWADSTPLKNVSALASAMRDMSLSSSRARASLTSRSARTECTT